MFIFILGALFIVVFVAVLVATLYVLPRTQLAASWRREARATPQYAMAAPTAELEDAFVQIGDGRHRLTYLGDGANLDPMSLP